MGARKGRKKENWEENFDNPSISAFYVITPKALQRGGAP